MGKYINPNGIPLSMAVYLASDYYDYQPDAISATQLLKPLRQVILARRVPPEYSLIDISTMAASRMGSAIHDAIEKAWITNKDTALKALGYPDHIIERVVVNPKPEELTPDSLPVYMEQRLTRQLGKYKISGKFDFVFEGKLEDFKSTSVYTYIKNSKDRDYQLQGSIYRWLDPKLITQDHMTIQFIFTDWQAYQAKADPNYPQHKILSKDIPLLTTTETENFIRNKLELIEQYSELPEEEIPLCNDEELWRKETTYKYYSNPDKLARSTKNFDSESEAYLYMQQKGNKGIVIQSKGQVSACKYCPAFYACTQKDALIADGSLTL